ISGAVRVTPRMGLAIAAFCALVVAVAWLLALPVLRLLAPAIAATSAAFWHCACASARRPTSMASATQPKKATSDTASNGMIAPRRALCFFLRIVTDSTGTGQLMVVHCPNWL